MEALFKSYNICWVGQACPCMSNVLQNNKAPISLGSVELFYLLHVVTHPWKLQVCMVCHTQSSMK